MAERPSQSIEDLLQFQNTLREGAYTVLSPLTVEVWVTEEPVPFRQRRSGRHLALNRGDRWGELFDCGWFRFRGKVPPEAPQEDLVLLIDVNGELLIVDERGNPLRGLTGGASTFDRALGEPVKRVYPLPPGDGGRTSLDLWAEGGCNDLFGELKENGTLKVAALAVCRREVRALYYDFEFLLNLLNAPGEGSPRSALLLQGLSQVSLIRDFSEAEVHRARKILAPLFSLPGPPPSLTISAVGHSHLDLAWLWPVRETRRKAGRTLATVLELMERYPDYVYGCSQPQMLAWVKEDYPELYRRFRRQVSRGRIDPLGAMWVESDANLPGGESLVRQILLGRRFWRKEFRREIDNLWLPDSFGFSAALPQILKKSGIRYFTTMKLAGNRINPFPHHSFRWRGIDGSEILVHMLPEGTYNSPATPASVLKIAAGYREKGVSSQALMAFGIGDGGGGPGAEHLERLLRMKKQTILPRVVMRKVSEFYPLWAQAAPQFPLWEGELYLEKHQGTYSTRAFCKRDNRRMEILLKNLEFVSVLALISHGAEYPSVFLDGLWKRVLLLQFHDILPGSSIERVYEETREDYRRMTEEAEDKLKETCGALAHGSEAPRTGTEEGLFVLNPLSWDRTEWILLEGTWRKVPIPSLGYTLTGMKATELGNGDFSWDANTLENRFYRLSFNPDGSLAALYDRECHRQVLKEGRSGNRFAVYADSGDAWDFPPEYRDRPPERFALMASTTRRDGPRLINTRTYRFMDSEAVQEILLWVDERRIDFHTTLSWHTPGRMVRTGFPVHVPGGRALCEIPFGAVERPIHDGTSRDVAMDEISAHRWIDISNGEYGVALLNDCKYGFRVKESTLEICLLRCVRPPGPEGGYTDLGGHEFTYSLLPHRGGPFRGGVVQAASRLNVPPPVLRIPWEGNPTTRRSFFRTGNRALIIDGVKKAEESEDIVLRLYESSGRPLSTWLASELFRPPEKVSVWLADLLEEEERPLEIKKGRVPIDARPYEILTIKIKRR